MGIESQKTRSSNEIFDQLLAQLPIELQNRWTNQLKDIDLSQGISILRDVLARRADATNEKPHTTELLRIRTELPDELVDAIKDIDRHAVEINRGYNGRIMRCRKSDTLRRSPLYKVLLHPPLLPGQNSLQSEAAFQADIHALSIAYAHIRVGVPRVYFFVSSGNVNVMAQEDISHAYSVKDILEKNILLPQSFNLERTFEALQLFVDCMHKHGFYHRDLREGNIMIDLNAGNNEGVPLVYVVDMGFTTKAGNEGEAYRGFTGPEDHAILRQVKESLKRYQVRQEASRV